MKPVDILLVLVIAAIVAAAVTYIVRAKKKGVKCIDCPAAADCAKKCCSGCASQQSDSQNRV